MIEHSIPSSSALASRAFLERVRAMALEALEGLPVSVWLFGSWARGEARSSSDIDLAVLPTGPLPDGTLAKLRLAFEESTIPYRVDLVDLRDVDEGFREAVQEEGIRWRA
jgi:predicted nucleotidyltransferase